MEAEEEASGDWREEVDPLVEDLVAQWETTKAGGGGVGVGGAEPGMRGKGDDVAIAVGDGKRNGKGEGISEGASADADVGARSEDGDVAGGHMQSVSDNVPERDDDDGEPTPDAGARCQALSTTTHSSLLSLRTVFRQQQMVALARACRGMG